MMKLIDILQGVPFEGLEDGGYLSKAIVFDSRKAERGDVFVAIKGTAMDGHDFIPQVINQGVQVIVCEREIQYCPKDVQCILVEDTHTALGLMASNFYENPSKEIKLVGVTGTNGKTTIATLLYNTFQNLGYPCGLLSTVCNYIGNEKVPATHTTPDPVQLNALLKQMVQKGCEYVFMEVSSHAIHQKRVEGLHFDGGVFTNITHDHLDYHKTFDAYIAAKKAFFNSLPNTAFALVNADDKRSEVMVQNTKAKVFKYSLRAIAEFKGKILEHHFDGMLLQIGQTEMWSRLIGEFNASNLLAVYGVAISFGIQGDEVLQAMSGLSNVEGRFEYLKSEDGVMAIIDYAHTPDALKNVLTTINQIRTGNESLITVVGCGGNRDKAKRPVMAKVAVDQSNQVIITSDNPRDEDPQEIIDDMLEGLDVIEKRKALSIVDRKEAIKTASFLAKPGDIILVAGKGHETYQEIKGERFYFSDKKEVAEHFLLNNMNSQ